MYVFSPTLGRHIISFSIILLAAKDHHQCCAVNLHNKIKVLLLFDIHTLERLFTTRRMWMWETWANVWASLSPWLFSESIYMLHITSNWLLVTNHNKKPDPCNNCSGLPYAYPQVCTTSALMCVNAVNMIGDISHSWHTSIKQILQLKRSCDQYWKSLFNQLPTSLNDHTHTRIHTKY